MKVGDKAFADKFKGKRNICDLNKIRRWRNGDTGMPLIDAHMR